MSFEERRAWMMLVVGFVGYGVYLVVVLGRVADVPVGEVAYVAPMLWMIGGAIAVSIVLHIAMSVVWPEDANQTDQRDKEITRFSEYVGQSLTAVGGVAALVLAMLEVAHFWIANTLLLGFFLASVLSCVAKISAYRRGFQ